MEALESSGIAVKVLTGDRPEVALQLCMDIGWSVKNTEVVTGATVDSVSDENLHLLVQRCDIFGNLRPDQKARIVQAITARGIHAAMVGDGVNDIPAMKAAGVSVAMGSGAMATREIADIVIADSSLPNLVRTLKEGKTALSTVALTAKLFLTKNLMIVALSLAAIFLGWEFPLTARRVALYNIFAIIVPTIYVAVSNRLQHESPIMVREVVGFSAISAAIVVGAGQFVFALTRAGGATEDSSQIAMLTVMTICAVASFFSASITLEYSEWKRHASFAFAMIVLFVILIVLPDSNVVSAGIHRFYEVRNIGLSNWLSVLLVSLGGSGVLLGTQAGLSRSIFKSKSARPHCA
jgi:cation-transporting ATPase E